MKIIDESYFKDVQTEDDELMSDGLPGEQKDLNLLSWMSCICFKINSFIE